MTKRKNAFTLAEVLITLAVIGIVAVLTLPTIKSNYEERVTITKVLKAHAILNNAYHMAIVQHGPLKFWGFSGASASGSYDEDGNYVIKPNTVDNAKIFMDSIAPYLNVVARYERGDEGCKFPNGIKRLDNVGYDVAYTTMLDLADGSRVFGMWLHSPNCPSEGYYSCGDLMVDINSAKKGPNTLGKDIFYFVITSSGIIPAGQRNLTNTTRYFPDKCDISSTTGYNGYACTAWVIENKNMDYLHCSDLSWDGKRKCSD